MIHETKLNNKKLNINDQILILGDLVPQLNIEQNSLINDFSLKLKWTFINLSSQYLKEYRITPRKNNTQQTIVTSK